MSAQETTTSRPAAAPAAPLPSSPAPLALVEDLCATLSATGVDYCHWKSNEAIDRSASGDNDLDILVRREHMGRFTEVVHALGFKQARQSHIKEFPGVLHFIGVDEATARFVDIHAHYQLVVGDDMTKNHRLPIERAYLASSRQGPIFRVPAPELELAMLVIRLVLKHATWDAKATFQGSLAASERREVGFLEARTDWGTVAAVVRDHLPFIDAELWDRCVAWVLREGPGWDGVREARDLSHALAAHTRAAWLPDMTRKIVRRGKLFTRRRLLRRPADRNWLEAGGAIIAVLGPDAEDRASAVHSTAAWLSTVFRTTTVEFRQPSPGADGAERPFPGPPDRRGTAALAREGLASWRRYRSYVQARRSSAQGRLVVCDGFPEPASVSTRGGAERAVPARGTGRLGRHLVERRERYERQALTPDLVLVLRDGAAAGSSSLRHLPRRPREDEPGAPAVVIDTRQPPELVLSAVKSAIWTRL